MFKKELHVKPMSVNEAWKGRRFKTEKYNRYEDALLKMLPKSGIPDPPFKVGFVFGVSNMAADIDNPVKPLLDILQKRYGFNDAAVLELNVRKIKAAKKREFISITIESFIE